MHACRVIVIFNILLSVFASVQASHRASPKDIANARASLHILQGDSLSEALIKQNYRKLSKQFHPDRYEGSKEDADRLFKEINAAQALLLDHIVRSKQSRGKSKSTSNWREHVHEDMSFDDIWQSAVISPEQQVNPEELALSGIFLTAFVRSTIFWTTEELSESDIARTWASEHITPGMRRCSKWLALMAFAKSNNWRRVEDILKIDPELINMHDETADALSLCESVLKDGMPASLRSGHEQVKEVLLAYGAVAKFPHYNGGFCGFAEGYMY